MNQEKRGLRRRDKTATPDIPSIDRDDEIRALRGARSADGGGTDVLIAERQCERELEERRAVRRGVGRP